MKRVSLSILFVLSFLILGHTGICSGQEFVWVPGEIIVKFQPGASDAAIEAINRGHGTSVLSTSPFAGFKRLKIPKSKTVSEMVEIYSRNPIRPTSILLVEIIP